MLLIRQAGPKDFSGVFPLAKLLDSYNLPADRRLIQKLLEDSERSFAGGLPRVRARYLFVLEDRPARRIVGCSLIIAKHGTPGHPHLWLARQRVVHRSRTLGIRRSQEVLQMGFTQDGPTEVGGFVVLPRWRNRRERCGLQLSYARFLYMAMHPGRFEGQVLIEYRGVMGRGTRSTFWEAIGRVFTGLSYSRADRLSVTHKEFILNLLPRERIYCALLPRSVQRAIGAIHPSAAPAARLAVRQGFRPIPQIEPFDGGPYYAVRRTKIKAVRETKRLRLCAEGKAFPRPVLTADCLVGVESRGEGFRAVRTEGRRSGDRFLLGQQALEVLEVQEGEWGHVYRIPR